ncbi:transposase [Streptosporangiaceae bacterium NEAU-GS5]|nr:transposase [Streptosporangiaceae bacterium NEAU-GS5]
MRTPRRVGDGNSWMAAGGCGPAAPWRDIPAYYGPWSAAYALFRRRQRDGTWARGAGRAALARPRRPS